MRKLVIAAAVVAVVFAVHGTANASTLSDWLASLFSFDTYTPHHIRPHSGSGDGMMND